MKALGFLMFTAGLLLAIAAGFVLSAGFTDWRARQCPGGSEACADAVGVMVLTGCGLIASLVMMFAGFVFVRR